MPNRDQTGPRGEGPRTGRGMGVCSGANSPMQGRFAGRGRGFRCFGLNFGGAQNKKEQLDAMEKELSQDLEEVRKMKEEAEK